VRVAEDVQPPATRGHCGATHAATDQVQPPPGGHQEAHERCGGDRGHRRDDAQRGELCGQCKQPLDDAPGERAAQGGDGADRVLRCGGE